MPLAPTPWDFANDLQIATAWWVKEKLASAGSQWSGFPSTRQECEDSITFIWDSENNRCGFNITNVDAITEELQNMISAMNDNTASLVQVINGIKLSGSTWTQSSHCITPINRYTCNWHLETYGFPLYVECFGINCELLRYPRLSWGPVHCAWWWVVGAEGWGWSLPYGYARMCW